MIFSQAVPEHVRLDIFDETIAELRRVLNQMDSSHEIDLKDHLGFSLKICVLVRIYGSQIYFLTLDFIPID